MGIDFRHLKEIIDEYAPDISVPVAEAIAPVNVRYWPSYSAGVMCSESFGTNICDKAYSIPLNLASAGEFIASSRSIPEYEERIRRVCHDTLNINAMCELGGDPGAFFAGVYANSAADFYVNERVITAWESRSLSQLDLSTQFDIALTKRRFQEELLTDAGLSREEALMMCNADNMSLDDLLVGSGEERGVGIFLENADKSSRYAFLSNIKNKFLSGVQFGIRGFYNLSGLTKVMTLTDEEMLKSGIIEPNPNYVDPNKIDYYNGVDDGPEFSSVVALGLSNSIAIEAIASDLTIVSFIIINPIRKYTHFKIRISLKLIMLPKTSLFPFQSILGPSQSIFEIDFLALI